MNENEFISIHESNGRKIYLNKKYISSIMYSPADDVTDVFLYGESQPYSFQGDHVSEILAELGGTEGGNDIAF